MYIKRILLYFLIIATKLKNFNKVNHYLPLCIIMDMLAFLSITVIVSAIICTAFSVILHLRITTKLLINVNEQHVCHILCTIVPTKSDSHMIFCLQLLSTMLPIKYYLVYFTLEDTVV